MFRTFNQTVPYQLQSNSAFTGSPSARRSVHSVSFSQFVTVCYKVRRLHTTSLITNVKRADAEMSAFVTLPIELLSDVLEHIIRPSQLANLCLVNNAFYSFSVPALYRRAFIYSWHKDGKLKVMVFLQRSFSVLFTVHSNLR